MKFDANLINKRVEEIRNSLGHNTTVFLEGYILGQLFVLPKVEKDKTVERFNKRVEKIIEEDKPHLEYIKDRFQLKSIEEAARLKSDVGNKLTAIIKKIVVAEFEVERKTAPENITSKIIEAIGVESKRLMGDGKNKN